MLERFYMILRIQEFDYSLIVNDFNNPIPYIEVIPFGLDDFLNMPATPSEPLGERSSKQSLE